MNEEGHRRECLRNLNSKLELALLKAELDKKRKSDNLHDIPKKLLTRNKQPAAFARKKLSSFAAIRRNGAGKYSRRNRCFSCDVPLRAFFEGYLWQVPMSIFLRADPLSFEVEISFCFINVEWLLVCSLEP